MTLQVLYLSAAASVCVTGTRRIISNENYILPPCCTWTINIRRCPNHSLRSKQQEVEKLLENDASDRPLNLTSVSCDHLTQARSQPYVNGGSFSLDFGLFSGFENWSSQWQSRENLDFQNNIDWWRYFVVRTRIYMVSLLDFINFIS